MAKKVANANGIFSNEKCKQSPNETMPMANKLLTDILVRLKRDVDELPNVALANVLARATHGQRGQREIVVVAGFVVLQHAQQIVLVHKVLWILAQCN